MTLNELTLSVKKEFPDTEEKIVCFLVNELESSISSEIFSPAGIKGRLEPLEPKRDKNTKLLLGEDKCCIYLYYIFSALSLILGDTEQSNAYTSLFNQKYEELAANTRRRHLPIKNTKLKGRDLP